MTFYLQHNKEGRVFIDKREQASSSSCTTPMATLITNLGFTRQDAVALGEVDLDKLATAQYLLIESHPASSRAIEVTARPAITSGAFR